MESHLKWKVSQHMHQSINILDICSVGFEIVDIVVVVVFTPLLPFANGFYRVSECVCCELTFKKLQMFVEKSVRNECILQYMPCKYFMKPDI